MRSDAPAAEPEPRSRLAVASRTERHWFVAAVLGTCVALAVFVVVAGPMHHGRARSIVLFLLVACGPVILLRRWPITVLAVAAALTAATMAIGVASLPVGLMLGLAMYSAALRLPRRRSLQAVAVTVGVLGVGLVLSTLVVPSPLVLEATVLSFLPLVAAWFVGDSVAARRRYLTGLAEQAQREREAEAERARQEVREERVRIARELHDVVAHTLAVITVQAGVGRRLMDGRPDEARTALDSIETIGRTAQDELRVVLGLLRDETGHRAELAPAPRLVDVKELVETVRASGCPVTLSTAGVDRPLSPALELSIYRVVQEALTNVVKHAPGTSAHVEIAASSREVRVEVLDDGGTSGVVRYGSSPAESGHGIVGMRERVAAFGGTLEAGPAAAGGFCVTASIPIEPGESS